MSNNPDPTELIFHAACAIEDQEKRRAYLARACEGQHGLRERLDALLEAHERAGSFLDVHFDDEDDASREKEGAIIGRYKLLQQIGRGGFGTVWMAEQREPVKRRVALKIINLGMDTKQVIGRFEAERQALALMDHPNIAKVFDAGTTETGRPYFVMELVRGVGMLEYCDREKLDTDARLGLFIDVCHAIQHAHQKGIIHRDVKPSNILVTLHDGKPVPKVIDFGIAKATSFELTTKTLFTAYGQMIGTPAYMSPEQAEMSGLDIDTRSDIYSLGVLLYELLTGTTPFDGRELMRHGLVEMLRVIRDVEPEKPSTRVSSLETALTTAEKRHVDARRLCVLLRGDLDWIVMRCLEKDRARRYETANGLAMDLSRHLKGEAVAAVPPSAGYRLRKFVTRNKAAVTAGSAVALTLVAGLLGTAWQAREAGHQADRAAERAHAAELAEAGQRHLRLEAEAARQGESEQRVAAENARNAEAAQRRAAEASAATAARVMAYIQDMLGSAAPDVMPKGANYTVREMLDEVARNLGDQLAGEPATELVIRRTIGRAYRSLGRLDDADRHFAKALDLAVTMKNEDLRLSVLVDTAGILHDRNDFAGAANLLRRVLESASPMGEGNLGALRLLGDVLGHDGIYGEAEHATREALETARRRYGNESPKLACFLHALANVLKEEGRLEEAESMFRDAWEKNRELTGEDHPDSLASMSNLAVVMAERGRASEAEPMLRHVLEGDRRLLGENHPRVAHSMTFLSLCLKGAGKLEEAEDLGREALALTRRLYPEGHADLADCLSHLATVIKDRGKLAEAESLFRESLAMERRIHRDGHPEVASTKVALGTALCDLGKVDEAESLLRSALASLREGLGTERQEIGDALNSLGLVLKKNGKLAESEAVLREALAVRRKVMGEEHPTVGTCMNNLAGLLFSERRYEEAESLARSGVAIWRKSYGNQHERVAIGIGGLASVLCERQKLEEAESLFRECLAIRRALPGDQRSEVAKTLTGLSVALRMMGKQAEAESACREALDLLRKAQGAPEADAAVATCMRNLAIATAERANFVEADALLRDAMAIRCKLLGDRHPEVAICLTDLAIFAAKRDKPEEAEDFFNRAVAISPDLAKDERLEGAYLEALAASLERLGRFKEAVPHRRKWMALVRRFEKPGSPSVEQSLAIFGTVLVKSGAAQDAAEAEPILRECLEMRKAAYPAGHEQVWRKFNAMSLLARALLCQERYSEAEPLLLGAYEGMKDDRRVQERFRHEALAAIARLYASWDEVEPGKGYDAKASEWRKHLSDGESASRSDSRAESRRRVAAK